MRTLHAVRTLLAAVAVLASSVPRAEPELALRLGVALPVGDAAPDAPLSDELSFEIPFQLDALWRSGRIAAGGYGAWAPAGAGSCLAGASCEASGWRAGLQATYGFPARRGQPGARGFEPWVGVAAGWEWATHRQSLGSEISTTWSGPELGLQAGIEWRVGRRLALGPLLAVGIGRYRSISVESDFDSGATDLPERSTHAWVHLGARARLVLGRGEP